MKNLQFGFFVLSLHSQSVNGALVQLVRIRACHARGQGFESPTHRTKGCKSSICKIYTLSYCLKLSCLF